MISVVVPCFNVADTLQVQVDRLLPQIIEHGGELVLIDNNSTDGTANMLRDLSRSPHIIVDSATERQSVAHARNAGVERASGDLLLFCDADDIVDDSWVEEMVTALEDHPVVTGHLETHSLNGNHQQQARGTSSGPATFYGIFLLAHGGNMGVRRSAWCEIGPLDETLASVEDMEWSMRAHLAGYNVAKAASAIIHYRYRSTPKALWSQGFAYGTFRPEVARRVHQHLGYRVGRLAGAKSWVWLFVHPLSWLSPNGRAQLAWVAGNRLGHLRGSLRSRFILL